MPLSGIDACKRALRVTRAQFQRGVGDLREVIRKRSRGVKKTRGQLRKLEAKVKELGGALSEEVSDGSSVLCDTSSDSDSDMVSDDAKAEPSSASDNGIGKRWHPASKLLRQRPPRPPRRKRELDPLPKPRPKLLRVRRPRPVGGASRVFLRSLQSRMLRCTTADPTPKVLGTLVSPKGILGVVRRASSFGEVLLALARSTARSAPGRFAVKLRKSS